MPSSDDKYTNASWSTAYQDLELPSGAVALVKRIDLPAIVAADMVDDFDKLAPTVDEKVVGPAKGKRPADRPAKKLTKKQLAEKEAADLAAFFTQDNVEMLTSLLGRILPHIVIKPKVHCPYVKTDGGAWVPIDFEDREDGAIYVDSIPLGDQMHILSFGMEGMDMDGLQSFREQSESPVGDVEVKPVREDPPL